MNSKISIIIPVYNTEEYVKKCINSVLNQSYQNIEIIIINDGSNEQCSFLLDKISKNNKKILLYNLKENIGVGAVRNIGIEKSTGDFIYFLDSDDYLPQKTIEILANNIKNHSLIRGRLKTTTFENSFVLIFDGHQNIKYFNEDRFKLIENSGVHNFLFKKNFIVNNNILFDEKNKLYVDLHFMIEIFSKIETVPYISEAVYFRRRRNRPIINPSLSQLSVGEKLNGLIPIFIKIKQKYKKNDFIQAFLDKFLLNFYRKEVTKYFQEKSIDEKLFQVLSSAFNEISQKSIDNSDFIFKIEINKIKLGKYKKFKRFFKRKIFLKDTINAFKSKDSMKLYAYKHIFSRLAKNKKMIIFESFQGKNYSDSPKYLYEYICKNELQYKKVWVFSEKRNDIPFKHIQVKKNSLSYFYYLAKSKYWIFNTRLSNLIEKPEDTIYIQTWHGTPLKQLAGDMDEVHMPKTNSERYKKNFYRETQKWDYLISPNQYSTHIFKRAFWYNSKMLNTGYPRNDILYNKNNFDDIHKIKKKLEIPKEKKVILYAPTWRDDEFYEKGKYKFQIKLDLNKYQHQLGEEYIILLRMHYVIATQLDLTGLEGFAYDFSLYDDVSELYLVSDMLITDYSSVFFDYANLKRPILFFAYDIERYGSSLRGFYIDMYTDLPGPIFKKSDEILAAIKQIDIINKEYETQYIKFYQRFCAWDDGNASKRVIEQVNL